MKSIDKVEQIFSKYNCKNFKWIDPKKIIVAQWVRMKCKFGCDEYGKSAVCPPNTPDVSDCEIFFREYSKAVIFHFAITVKKPQDRFKWTKKINSKLIKLERDIFLKGFPKTFLLYMDTCILCPDCVVDKSRCKYPKIARPAAEALAVDVFSTVRQFGFPIDVLYDYCQKMNRYALLMVD